MSSAALPTRSRHAVRWEHFLWVPGLVSLILLVVPQASFIWMSLHRDTGFGSVGDELTFANYATILTDPFYLGSIWLTLRLSAIATIAVLIVAMPTAYSFARLGGLTASVLLGLVLTTSLVTIVIKILGLNIILGSTGIINEALAGLGVTDRPIAMINNEIGVLIGLMHYTLPIAILMLFAVCQTIPLWLEEAAAIHGATRGAIFLRVILPIMRPGLIATALIAFNMNVGAFTSALLLGGGRVRTMPVLIQQEIIQGNRYAMGAALATTMLVIVFVLNVAVALSMTSRRRKAR
ncbi:ABC transporter permease [Futiania mangrovi]|uniref:ABC transporter permease n=1 Tax=Futiania mangrovi TaxID=2959716 RepID=A0A9J6PKP0_9PROT|nr:ABC transporter permease [Futiania mangrovii]MCP1337151.1 ABC transporter permease [Futiania mangrovii]